MSLSYAIAGTGSSHYCPFWLFRRFFFASIMEKSIVRFAYLAALQPLSANEKKVNKIIIAFRSFFFPRNYWLETFHTANGVTFFSAVSKKHSQTQIINTWGRSRRQGSGSQKKSLSPLIRARRIKSNVFCRRCRFISIKLWAIAPSEINWKANDIVSVASASARFFGSLQFRVFAMIERINNSTHYQFSHFVCAGSRSLAGLLSRWKFMQFSIISFGLTRGIRMFDHQNINRKRRQFRNLKNVDFSIILARRAKKIDDDANAITNVCENFSPLPCEGRFRSRIWTGFEANVYRLSDCWTVETRFKCTSK